MPEVVSKMAKIGASLQTPLAFWPPSYNNNNNNNDRLTAFDPGQPG